MISSLILTKCVMSDLDHLLPPADGQAQPGPPDKVDKRSRVPAYAQLASILRSNISQGLYSPGERLPSETALAKAHGVSAMTARQAVSVLEEERLIRRIQGKGTFVRKIQVATTTFNLDALREVFADQENLSVRIISSKVEKTTGIAHEFLQLPPGHSVILVERIVYYKKKAFTLHVSYAAVDPKSPTVESMLDTTVLTELLSQEGYSRFKRGVLRLLPTLLEKREAGLLELEQGKPIFRIEHYFYDFENKPAAIGWFLVAPEIMPLVSRIGIWDE